MPIREQHVSEIVAQRDPFETVIEAVDEGGDRLEVNVGQPAPVKVVGQNQQRVSQPGQKDRARVQEQPDVRGVHDEHGKGEPGPGG